MGQWQAEVFLSGAGPRGTGINEPAETGLYPIKCVDSERVEAKSSGRPGTLLKLEITDGASKGMQVQIRLWDAKVDDKQGARDAMTASYKSALLGLGHSEEQVMGIVDKSIPMNQSHFEGRSGFAWIEKSNPDLGWDFPEVQIMTPTQADEIAAETRIPRLKHNRQNPNKAPVGAAPAGGGLLGTPSNGAGAVLPTPPALGGGSGGAKLDSLLG